ncbi:MAG: hypothetical protein K0R93_3697 [Anaerosolibacter sp.]|uniref:stalk domain-containing protein n=1 Tax=Anaerosolibacter sp. TaxID=1872527 RepID=UPI00262D100F|nr:stalk domain-containing protein [Anaerosolibacter sp.]MDF2548799.1 hypothetical protein [Anaerosolibacter sp.]
MKRGIVFLIIFAVLLPVPLSVGATQETKVTIDGQQLSFDVPPTLVQGRTLVPLRTIFESLGAKIEWDAATKTVTGTKGNTIIILTVDKKTATVNGKAVELEVPGTIINNRTLVPARFIAEALGANVGWDGNTKTVIIKSTADDAVTTYKITKIVDGDTIEIDYNGTKERVRLIGVDTPESVHPDATRNSEYGKVASEFSNKQLDGKTVTLEFDVQERDKYGRLLAYVYVDGIMYNKILVSEGYAKVATFPPNVKYVADFTALEKQAREQNKGLWAYEETVSVPATPSQPSQSAAPTVIMNTIKAKAGENVTATIGGSPGVEYDIEVYYSSGPSKAAGLEPKKADSNGNVSWTWKVGSKTNPGQYKIVIKGDMTMQLTLEVE